MANSVAWWLVIPAAGVGQRMQAGQPKQYLSMGGDRHMLAITLSRFLELPGLQGVVLALAGDDPGEHDWLPRLPVPLRLVVGGPTRAISVRNALTAVQAEASEDTWVLVHDAARPCVRPEDVRRLLHVGSQAEGAILGVPVRDTMKRVRPDGVIEATVPRGNLYHALTPQMFRLGALRRALDDASRAGASVTDEASAMERAGVAPRLVEGSQDNIKVTYPEDLSLAVEILRAQGVLGAAVTARAGATL
ncbi:MAG: 2-C-methyl-D-erythritol 4-phosphate cytidylyltransferase [Halothiobacillaceae bacterium]